MDGVVDRDSLNERKRRTVRILLAIVAALVLTSFAVGIRW
jgi:hypothetical protein